MATGHLLSVDISFEDFITVILFLRVFFMDKADDFLFLWAYSKKVAHHNLWIYVVFEQHKEEKRTLEFPVGNIIRIREF